jgi:hypothetical protein
VSLQSWSAAALGTLARDYMQPDLAAIILRDLGIGLADLEAADADADDLERLRADDACSCCRRRPSHRGPTTRRR